MADNIEPTETTPVIEVQSELVIDFVKTSDDGVYSFSDAIRLPVDHSFTEAEIEAMKQERFDNWLNYVLAPAAEQAVTEPIVEVTAEPIV